MPEQKVVPFPGRGADRFGDLDAGFPVHDLLREDVRGRGLVSFVDVAALDETSLLAIVARNHVGAVVDVRPSPVFDKPRFRHREVVFHLYRHGIPYIELAMLAIWPASERRLGTFMREETFAALEAGLDRGLALCLYDADAREDGWLEEARRMIRQSRGFRAELLPTALVP